MANTSKSVQVAVRLTATEKREIGRTAKRANATLSDFCRDAIREKLARDAKEAE